MSDESPRQWMAAELEAARRECRKWKHTAEDFQVQLERLIFHDAKATEELAEVKGMLESEIDARGSLAAVVRDMLGEMRQLRQQLARASESAISARLRECRAALDQIHDIAERELPLREAEGWPRFEE